MSSVLSGRFHMEIDMWKKRESGWWTGLSQDLELYLVYSTSLLITWFSYTAELPATAAGTA